MGSKRPSNNSLIHFYKRVWTITVSTIMSYISTFSLFAVVICVVSSVAAQGVPPPMPPPMTPPAPTMDPMMMMLLLSGGSDGDMSNMMLMMMMMGGNMDPMMMMLMMSMNTCKEPTEDCTEINNDDRLLCGVVADISDVNIKAAADALSGSNVIKPCCKCSKKKGLF